MRRYTLMLAAVALGAMTLAFPAQAQRRAEITQGMTSGDLAANMDSLRASNAELGARLTGLEADRAALAGKVETLEFLLSQSRDEINQMQTDDAEIDRLISRLEATIEAQDARVQALEARLDQITASALDQTSVDMGLVADPAGDAKNSAQTSETTSLGSGGPTRVVRRVSDQGAPAGATPGSLGTLPASALPGDAGSLFAEAKSRLLQFDYSGAEAAFRAFLTEFDEDPQAGEAQYWLAEVLYQQEAYSESGQAYTQMIREYPDDARAPEALAKLARSMRLVGDTDQACNALNILPQRYPDASGVTRNLAAGERVRSGCDS